MTVPAVSAVSAAVVTSTAKTTMVSAVVERTVMVPAVMPTAVIPTVSKVAGADETVHNESDTGYRQLTLTAEPNTSVSNRTKAIVPQTRAP